MVYIRYLYTRKMKKYYTLFALIVPVFVSAQLKEIAFAELTSGSGMFFGAQMSTTTITVTVQGPSDRFLGFGFGSGMSNGNDAIIWSTTGTGTAPLQLRDHHMIGEGIEPAIDGQQDWTVTSNTVSGGNRTIVATRALSTGDANDVTFNFSATSQALFWAKGSGASTALAYHGATNRANGIIRNWVLVDQTPPVVSTLSPADNTIGAGLTQNLVMSFNENIAWGTGSVSLYNGGGTLIQTVSNGSPGVSVSGPTLTWNPTANLVLNTDYYVQVDPTAIKDIAGNFYAGIADNTTWSFNTNDVIAPTLASNAFTPADNATGVSLTTNLSATFSEAVQPGTGNIVLHLAGGSVVESFDVNSSSAVTVSGSTVTINPSADLVLGNDYYVTIDNGAIHDITGNAYAGFSSASTWNFSTYDIVPPSLLVVSPMDNATGVTLNPTIQLTFNEPIELSGTGTLELHTTSATIESFSQANSNITITGSVATLVPSAPLTDLTDYYIVMNGTVIADTSDNAYSGLSATTDWNFTTGDFTGPVLAAAPFVPADDATFVPVSTTLTATFSESIQQGTGEIRLINDNISTTETFSSTQGTVSISGATITLTPASSLAELMNYHVEIDPDAITDLAGNAYAGFTDATTWNFTIETTEGLDEHANAGIWWNGQTLKLDNPEAAAVVYSTDGKFIRFVSETPASLSDLTTGVYLLHISDSVSSQTVRIYVR